MDLSGQLVEAVVAGLFCGLVWTLALGWQPRAFVAWVVNGGVLAFIALHGPIVLGGG